MISKHEGGSALFYASYFFPPPSLIFPRSPLAGFFLNPIGQRQVTCSRFSRREAWESKCLAFSDEAGEWIR